MDVVIAPAIGSAMILLLGVATGMSIYRTHWGGYISFGFYYLDANTRVKWKI